MRAIRKIFAININIDIDKSSIDSNAYIFYSVNHVFILLMVEKGRYCLFLLFFFIYHIHGYNCQRCLIMIIFTLMQLSLSSYSFTLLNLS